MSRRSRTVALAVAGVCVGALPALAETQISVYGGANSNLSSDVRVSGAPGVPNHERSIDWDGGSFEMPPYWGVRGTHWLNKGASWGLAVDYTHAKAIADIKYGNPSEEFSRLEFTDGNNLVMFDLLYRFSPWMNGTLVPYVGAGIGVTIPHVEVTLRETDNRTFEYQCCGFAAQAVAGLEYKLNETWSLFTEGRISYSRIDADLNGGGRLETDLWSPQFAVGVTYRFNSF